MAKAAGATQIPVKVMAATHQPVTRRPGQGRIATRPGTRQHSLPRTRQHSLPPCLRDLRFLRARVVGQRFCASMVVAGMMRASGCKRTASFKQHPALSSSSSAPPTVAACGFPPRQAVEGQKGPPLTPTGILTRSRLWTASYGSKVPFTASSATHRARRTPYHTCPTRRLGRSSWRRSSADTCRARTSGSWQGSTIVCARVAHVASFARCVSRRGREAARIALWLLGARVARQSMRARRAHQ